MPAAAVLAKNGYQRNYSEHYWRGLHGDWQQNCKLGRDAYWLATEPLYHIVRTNGGLLDLGLMPYISFEIVLIG